MAKKKVLRAVALYERLSRDDENQGESNSIVNQKMYLETFAEKQGFAPIRHFTDDGYSGVNFNRPGFQKMLEEIKNGNISTVIVKDMSRLGRNYLEVGYYTEVLFPQKDVRFIAVNNSVDSDNQMGNDFAPFLNIMNEWYAKDTSNKIRTVFDARMKDGKRCSGSIPYGYNRRPDDKQTLVVDPVASKVVKKIFEMAAAGMGMTAIAKQLEEERVLIPSAYTKKYHPEQNNGKTFADPYRWRQGTIQDILFRREYLGHTVLRKSTSVNFKTKKRKAVDPEDMLLFENTHEPIISQELWDQAHKFISRQRRKRIVRYSGISNSHKLCGFVFCADCGGRMKISVHYRKNGEPVFSFRCGTASSDHRKCSTHHISAEALEQLLLSTIQRISRRVITDEKAFAEDLQKQQKQREAERPAKDREELRNAETRYEQLDSLIMGLYEAHVQGDLPEKQYKSLMARYAREQDELEKKIDSLRVSLEEQEERPMQISQFIEAIRRFKNTERLTDEMIRVLVDKILVHEPQGRGKKRTQSVEIIFNFVGAVDLIETPEEQDERERKLKAEEEKKQQRIRSNNRKARQKRKEMRLAENEGHLYQKKVCAVCGNEFWPVSAHQIYCSPECKQKRDREVLLEKRRAVKGDHRFRQKKCIVCGKMFWPATGRQETCSEKCRIEHRNTRSLAYYHEHKRTARIEKHAAERAAVEAENEGHLYPKKTCAFCGEEFWPTMKFQKYCSKECGKRGYEQMDKERDPAEKEGHKFYKRICEVCGKEFWPSGPNAQVCSHECRLQLDRDLREAKKKKNLERNITVPVPMLTNGGISHEQDQADVL